jgi:hypothetical protein
VPSSSDPPKSPRPRLRTAMGSVARTRGRARPPKSFGLTPLLSVAREARLGSKRAKESSDGPHFKSRLLLREAVSPAPRRKSLGAFATRSDALRPKKLLHPKTAQVDEGRAWSLLVYLLHVPGPS